MNNNYDFAGWAARNDVLCTDGTTVKKGAFAHQDGAKVALVWGHEHGTPHTVVGHAILEDREEGTYTYGYLNHSPAGLDAKEAIRHKDIDSLSIYANKVKFGGATGRDIMHGDIREVSLVFAGADPTARIEYVLEHDESAGEGAIVYNGLVQDFEIQHEEEPVTEEPVAEAAPEEEIAHAEDKTLNDEVSHADEKKEEDKPVAEAKEKTLEEIVNSMNEEQKTALYALVGLALEDGGEDEGEEEKEDKTSKDSQEDKSVKHNIFEDTNTVVRHGLSDDDVATIFRDAARGGSLKDAYEDFIAHSDTIAHTVTDDDNNTVTYGIANVKYAYPDYHATSAQPVFAKRDNTWVGKVLNSVHYSPFNRIKSLVADITMDDARAKGYTKGNLKKEEVFSLLKRTTDPQTIYKRQKLDRDDLLDITDFDVVAWLKTELKIMLDEEKARAILVGDGRTALAEDKIKEDHIRPVWTDADLYTVKVAVDFTGLATANAKAKAIIDAVIRNRKSYKGSGNPTYFLPDDILSEMLLIEDTTGRKIYKDVNELANTLRVKEIVSVPVMESLSRSVTTGSGQSATTTTYNLLGIMVNLDDYTVGANRQSRETLFEDFDIDYNQQKYLLEERACGALTLPYSAIAFETTGSFTAG